MGTSTATSVLEWFYLLYLSCPIQSVCVRVLRIVFFLLHIICVFVFLFLFFGSTNVHFNFGALERHELWLVMSIHKEEQIERVGDREKKKRNATSNWWAHIQ